MTTSNFTLSMINKQSAKNKSICQVNIKDVDICKTAVVGSFQNGS